MKVKEHMLHLWKQRRRKWLMCRNFLNKERQNGRWRWVTESIICFLSITHWLLWSVYHYGLSRCHWVHWKIFSFSQFWFRTYIIPRQQNQVILWVSDYTIPRPAGNYWKCSLHIWNHQVEKSQIHTYIHQT